METRTLTDAWRALPGEARLVAERMPRLLPFGLLLLGWLALFHWFGNSTLGYVKTTSLLGWMEYAYWGSEDDKLGYAIPFLVLGLLWWRREELLAVPKRPWWPALALLGLAVLLHVVGFMVQQTRVSVLAFFAGLWFLTGLVWGPAWLRASFFPFLLLAFAVPLGNSAERLTFPLRLLATQITVGLAHVVLGLGVIGSGTSIYDPAGRYQYEVAAACSGIRSLTAILVLTLIYAFMGFRSWWRRAAVVASSFPLAVAGNVLRLSVIIIAAEGFGQAAGTKVHDSLWFSLLPYLLSFVGLVLLGRWLEEPRAPAPSARPRLYPAQRELVWIAALVAGLAVLSESTLGNRMREQLVLCAAEIALSLSGLLALGCVVAGWRFEAKEHAAAGRAGWAIVAMGYVLFAGGAGMGVHLQRVQHLGLPGVKVVPESIAGLDPQAPKTNQWFVAGTNSVYLPPRVLDYESRVQPVQKIVWDWLPKDTTYGQRDYRAPDDFRILNQVVLMGSDRTSIHQPQYCLTGSGWRIVAEEKATVRIMKPHPYDLPVMKLLTRGRFKDKQGVARDDSGVFVYWFVADNELTADHWERMWWMARDLIREGTLQRWAYVICFASCRPGQEAATFQRMQEFMRESVPQYQLTAGAPAVTAAAPASRAER